MVGELPQQEKFDQCEVVNLANPDNWKFVIYGQERLSFLCKSITLPEISLEAVDAPFPSVDAKLHGDKLVISDLSITFLLERNLKSYIRLFNWISGSVPAGGDFPPQLDDHFSRGLLAQFDDAGNQVMVYVMEDIFPKTVSGYELESYEEAPERLITATFAVNRVYIDTTADIN